MPIPQRTRRASSEEGFTLIEVMVAAIVLVTGLLGVLTLVDRAALTTTRTQNREGATNVAREIIERTRQVAYASLTPTGATAVLGAQVPGAAASADGTWHVVRRHTTYTFTATACSVDDASDGYGAETSSFCGAPVGTSSTATTDPTAAQGVAVSLVLGGQTITVPAGGSILSTVCAALGTNSALSTAIGGSATQLLGMARAGADLNVCPGGGAQVALDTQPDDYKRVAVTVSWDGGHPATVRQSILVPAPGGGATS